VRSGNTAYGGGGMYNTASSPNLTNVIFISNTASYEGGGIYNHLSTPKLTKVTFNGNTANNGGGMINDVSSPGLTGVNFNGNRANDLGGGVYNNNSFPTLTNVTFSGNTATTGGGMCNYQSNPKLTNNTFSGNTATIGGGMVNADHSSPTLTNVTFSGNITYLSSSIHNFNYSNPIFTNVILWNSGIYEISNEEHSVPVVAFSDIRNCGSSGIDWRPVCGTDNGGNIEAYPNFVDADGFDNVAGTADDNLRLDYDSPAIDAGSNSAVPSSVTTDLDGNPRIVNGVVDMGAYEAFVNKIHLPLVLRNTP